MWSTRGGLFIHLLMCIGVCLELQFCIALGFSYLLCSASGFLSAIGFEDVLSPYKTSVYHSTGYCVRG